MFNKILFRLKIQSPVQLPKPSNLRYEVFTAKLTIVPIFWNILVIPTHTKSAHYSLVSPKQNEKLLFNTQSSVDNIDIQSPRWNISNLGKKFGHIHCPRYFPKTEFNIPSGKKETNSSGKYSSGKELQDVQKYSLFSCITAIVQKTLVLTLQAKKINFEPELLTLQAVQIWKFPSENQNSLFRQKKLRSHVRKNTHSSVDNYPKSDPHCASQPKI
jgi:hypothetical protein